MRAAIYARVSTGRQAAQELSIPDQIAQCEAYCATRGWMVERSFIDAGRSATTDNRPEFQAMIAEACSFAKPFDVILVHSQSRFARNLEHLLHYRRRLERAGVALICITQDLGGGDAADLALTFMGVMDEYQSKETSKHVSRSMIENARQGFWNGAKPPFGYRTYVAERRGKKDKKKLEIAPREAETVRLIFQLYVYGDGRTGPIGLKQIASYLNARNITNTSGQPFRIQLLQKILRNSAYIGEHYFNKRDSRSGELRPQKEWVPLKTPRIVSDADFYVAQDRLDRQHPIRTPPRIVNSEILLTGLAKCACCHAPLRIQTGKSGAYRYYKCSKRADQGAAVCSGCSMRMETLDDLVLGALADRVLAPERLSELLPMLIACARDERIDCTNRLRDLKGEQRKLKAQISTLYEQVANGMLELDPTLSTHIKDLQNRHEELLRSIARLERRRSAPLKPLSKVSVEKFSVAFRERLLNRQDRKLARAYARMLLDSVEVSAEQIMLRGSEAVLAQAATTYESAGQLVPAFDQQWRASKEKLRTRFSKL